MEKSKIRELTGQLTLEEKAGLCSGKDFWRTKAVERLGIPQIMVSDGPHGLRKQDDDADHLGINDAIKAVCFPAGCASASSFNRELIEEVGEALGEECQAEGVSTLLGPGVCIKRSPICGRNFEYFSEDPYVASEMATAFIKGVQSKGVGTSIKHFLANSQEHRRMSSSSDVDERTLREIYLASFEGAVKNAKPWTIMNSYNRINGTYAAENKKFLTDILRNEWGYEGIVVSDWGAVNNRVADLEAGCDLEMPAAHGNDELIIDAVKSGKLDESVLDTAVERLLDWIFKAVENKKERYVWDRKADHEKAKKAARETIVLLKNDDDILPLTKGAKVAFIGKYADKPRYQGGGSSHINSMYVTSAYAAAKDAGIANVSFAKGFDDKEDKYDEALANEAIELAKNSDVAVVFAGLPDSFESEGYDRRHMSMPLSQNRLIEEIAAVQPNVVVVLHNGSPVEMPWIDKVPAVLEAYLSGEGVGAAECEILFGDVNPSGRLAESFPLKLEHNPSYLYYFGEGDVTEYREGVYVGYRYYDKKQIPLLFPFGHGLSYTNFEYSDLTLDKEEYTEGEKLKVSVKVTNTGKRAGKEAVLLFVGARDTDYVLRPVKELRAFDKVELLAGESKVVEFELDSRAFSYYETKISDWFVESGDYEIIIARSAEDIRLVKSIKVKGTKKRPFIITPDTTCGDLLQFPECNEMIAKYVADYMTLFDDGDSAASEAMSPEMIKRQFEYNPLRSVVSFSLRKPITMEEVKKFVDGLNALINS